MKVNKAKKKIQIIIGVIISIITVTIFLMWLMGWPTPRVDIEQEVTINKILTDKYNVRTYVWVFFSGEVHIEKIFSAYRIRCENINSHLKHQLEQAEKLKLELKEKLKTFEYCKY